MARGAALAMAGAIGLSMAAAAPAFATHYGPYYKNCNSSTRVATAHATFGYQDGNEIDMYLTPGGSVTPGGFGTGTHYMSIGSHAVYFDVYGPIVSNIGSSCET